MRRSRIALIFVGTLLLTTCGGTGGGTPPPIINPQQWTIGNGSYALKFTNGIPDDDRTYITNLYGQVYVQDFPNESVPIGIKLLGPPPDVSDLTVDVAVGVSGYSPHTIWMGSLPSAPGIQDSWNYYFTHETAHAYSLSSHTIPFVDWYEEGFADAGARLIRHAIGTEILQYSSFELDYDVLRLGGPEIVGGTAGKNHRGEPESKVLNMESGAEALLILATTQSSAAVGSWRDYTALASLKSNLYTIINRKQAGYAEDDLLTAMASTFSHPIEGKTASQWMADQPVAQMVGSNGTYLYVFPAPAANPRWLEVVGFQRLSAGNEIACTSGQVVITITNPSGTTAAISLDLANQSHLIAISSNTYPRTSHRIQASGTCNGVNVIAPDSYFGVYDPALAPEGQEIGALSSVFFLIGRNPDGSPSSKLLPEPTGGPAGNFLRSATDIVQNANGVAIWQVRTASPNPQVEYDWLGRRLYVPLPFSPVFVGVTPD